MASIYGSDADSVSDGAGEGGRGSDAAGAIADVALLYREQFVHLTRLATMLVGDRETAEDIVQDAFARVHKRWRRLSDPTRAQQYLRAAVINGARSVLRRRRVAAALPSDPPREEQPAEQTALAGLREGSIRAAVAMLPARQQEVILLRYLQDLSVAETARVLGISGGAVKASAGRAITNLATILGGDDD